MLVNVSYNNTEITRKVDAVVGKPFTLKERWAMGGIGSPRLFITETSIEIRNLLILDNNRDQCNVEIRPKGIIVRFLSLIHISEPTRRTPISYAVFCLKKKK